MLTSYANIYINKDCIKINIFAFISCITKWARETPKYTWLSFHHVYLCILKIAPPTPPELWSNQLDPINKVFIVQNKLDFLQLTETFFKRVLKIDWLRVVFILFYWKFKHTIKTRTRIRCSGNQSKLLSTKCNFWIFL